jgi:hypothetical protein
VTASPAVPQDRKSWHSSFSASFCERHQSTASLWLLVHKPCLQKMDRDLIWCQCGSVLAKEPVPSSPDSNSSLLSYPPVTSLLLHPPLHSSNLKPRSHAEVGELFRHPQLNHLLLDLPNLILDRLVLPVSFKVTRATSCRTPRTPPIPPRSI